MQEIKKDIKGLICEFIPVIAFIALLFLITFLVMR